MRGFVILLLCLVAAPLSAGELITARRPLVGDLPEDVVDREIVEIDTALLASAPAGLSLTLPDGRSYDFDRVETERRGPGSLAWWGALRGSEQGVIDLTLTLENNHLFGTLTAPEGLYVLAPAPDPLPGFEAASGITHFLSEIEPRGGVECGGVLSPPESLIAGEDPWTARSGAGPFPASAGAGGQPRIDFLVLYTPRARGAAGGKAAIEARIRGYVDLATTAFQNSLVNARAALAHVEERDFVPIPAAFSSVLNSLTFDPEIAELRDRFGADIVSLILEEGSDTTDPGICGLAWLMGRSRLGPQMAPRAFNATGRRCAERLFTFVHEAGHNLGLSHDPESSNQTPAQASFAWSFAHVIPGSFRTMMSTTQLCAGGSTPCPRLVQFSHPGLSFEGLPTGVPNQRDNHRSLLSTTPIAAAFRAPVFPAAPGNLTAEAESESEIRLTWEDRSFNESGFLIDQRVEDGPFQGILGTLAAGSQGALVGGLEPDTEYSFRVRARNHAGFSPFSSEASATTFPVLPEAPDQLSAEALSGTEIRLTWRDNSTRELEFRLEATSPAGPFAEILTLAADAVETTLTGLAPGTPYTFRLRASNDAGFSDYTSEVNVTTLDATGPCVGGAETLCLLGERFEVKVRWRNPREPFGDGPGLALTVPGSELTGLFWFFGPDNIELIVKMLDGGTVNGFFWHFYGALSDVAYWITVRDTITEETLTYYNPPFEICGVGDTQAFSQGAPLSDQISAPTNPSPVPIPARASSATATGLCTPSATALCLFEDRFRVEVDWINPRIEGDQGSGRVASEIATAETGFFWFFSPQNLELVVKILDGRALTGHFWFFWGGLSDVEYTITVTDTETGARHIYDNEPFSICGGADVGKRVA